MKLRWCNNGQRQSTKWKKPSLWCGTLGKHLGLNLDHPFYAIFWKWANKTHRYWSVMYSNVSAEINRVNLWFSILSGYAFDDDDEQHQQQQGEKNNLCRSVTAMHSQKCLWKQRWMDGCTGGMKWWVGERLTGCSCQMETLLHAFQACRFNWNILSIINS